MRNSNPLQEDSTSGCARLSVNTLIISTLDTYKIKQQDVEEKEKDEEEDEEEKEHS